MKSKYFRPALFIGMAGLILLSACSSGVTPTTTVLPTETMLALSTETTAPTQTSMTAASNSQAYPAPVEQTLPALAYPVPGAYPGPAVANAGPTASAVATTATESAAAPLTTPTNPAPKATLDVNAELTATDPSSVQLAAGKPQLIEFFAFWDGTSKAMTPLMHTLEEDYTDRVNFIFLDIDNPAVNQLKQQLGFKVQPQFYLLDAKGTILKQWSGSVTEADFRAALEAALK